MLTLIRNGDVYAPVYLGKKDLLLVGNKIGFIRDKIEVPELFVEIKVIDAAGKKVVPGFIDSHVHIADTGDTVWHHDTCRGHWHRRHYPEDGQSGGKSQGS
jgi:dihydroorotase-like cyclic amidohydrolase